MICVAYSKGVAVVEIRSLKATELLPPHGEVWILIEKKEDVWFIRGQSKEASAEAFLSATGWDSAALAIRSAEAWADLLMAAVIYVRDDSETRPVSSAKDAAP